MEYLEENKDWFIEDLIEKINDFYEKGAVSKDGARFFFEDKPNMQRLKFVISELMYQKIEQIPLSDKELVLTVFTKEMHSHIINNITSQKKENPELAELLFALNSRLILLYKEKEKDVCLQQIHNQLFSLFKKGERISKSYIQQYKGKIEGVVYGKIIKITGTEENPVLLIQVPSGVLFFLDINKNTILHTCGNVLEKGYSFDNNKVYVFDQKHEISRDKFTYLLEKFLLANDSCTVEDFLNHIQEKYPIDKDLSKDTINWENMLTMDLDSFSQNPNLVLGLLVIINHVGYLKKQIFVDTGKEIHNLGTVDSYETPNKLKEGYMNKPGIQIFFQKDGKKGVIVTNGEDLDTFDLE